MKEELKPLFEELEKHKNDDYKTFLKYIYEKFPPVNPAHKLNLKTKSEDDTKSKDKEDAVKVDGRDDKGKDGVGNDDNDRGDDKGKDGVDVDDDNGDVVGDDWNDDSLPDLVLEDDSDDMDVNVDYDSDDDLPDLVDVDDDGDDDEDVDESDNEDDDWTDVDDSEDDQDDDSSDEDDGEDDDEDDKKDEDEGDDFMVKYKALQKAIIHFHPDRVKEDEHGLKAKVLNEEITKYLTNRYEQVKSMK